jgi:hypothetical protein
MRVVAQVCAHHAQHSIHCRVHSELEKPMILVVPAYAQISDIVKTELYSVGCLVCISLTVSPIMFPDAMLSTAMILSKGLMTKHTSTGLSHLLKKTNETREIQYSRTVP